MILKNISEIKKINSFRYFKSFRLLGLAIMLLLLLCQSGCKKLVDIKAPVTSINQANVYSNEATAISVLTGIYGVMSNGTGPSGFSGQQSVGFYTALSSDEFTLFNGSSNQSFIAYYKNALVSNSSKNYGSESWSKLYSFIFTCNASIDGLTSSVSLTPAIKDQLLGEAKFLRAFFYFYLTNLYGDVPLILSSDYLVNSTLPKSTKESIYQQIIADLKEAQNLLSSNYLNGTLQGSGGDRVRPTKWAARAMLARVYLYHGDWADAEQQATAVISNSSLFSLETLTNTFLKTSREAIWQLQPVRIGHNTEDALVLIPLSTGPDDNHPVYISKQLLNSFEPSDQRKSNWINSVVVGGVTYYYPYKYKINTLNSPVTEYLMVLRLSEQYLIRAEAKAQLNKISEAQADLNAVRTRAGLGNTSANDKISLLAAILHERQVELFSELGHRWLDLKRTGNVDAVMTQITPLKGGTWQSYQQLYPILYIDVQRDVNLKQNPGY